MKIVPSSLTEPGTNMSRYVVAIDDKRQITAVLAYTSMGTFQPPQLIYEGKTEKCYSGLSFPTSWHNHWDNEWNICA